MVLGTDIPSQNSDTTGLVKKIPALSPYIAKMLLDPTKGPAAAYKAHYLLGGKDTPKTTTRSLSLGKVVDRLVFGMGPEIMLSQRSKKAEPVQLQTGTTKEPPCFVTALVFAQATAIASKVQEYLGTRGLFPSLANRQLSWTWVSEGDVYCKGKPDWVVEAQASHTTIFDLKTAAFIDDQSIEQAIRRYGYDVQAAAYLEGFSRIHQANAEFKWLFVSTVDPYQCRIVVPSSHMIGEGTAKWLKAAAIWKDCLASGNWVTADPEPMQATTYQERYQAKVDLFNS